MAKISKIDKMVSDGLSPREIASQLGMDLQVALNKMAYTRPNSGFTLVHVKSVEAELRQSRNDFFEAVQMVLRESQELREAALAEDCLKVYLFVFNSFAADTADVMDQYSKTREEALNILWHLENKGLVVGDYNETEGVRTDSRKRSPGTNKVWQCTPDHDSITAEQAVDLFNLNFLGKPTTETATK